MASRFIGISYVNTTISARYKLLQESVKCKSITRL